MSRFKNWAIHYNNPFSCMEEEKLTWSQDHTIVYDEIGRSTSLDEINKKIPIGTNVSLAYQKERTFGNVNYEHWFILFTTNEQENYCLEFCCAFNYKNACVQIRQHSHKDVQIELTGTLDDKMRDRMLHVLGMTNFSLCLRNCEHVANYIFRGNWSSLQIGHDSGPLYPYFKGLLGEKDLRKLNTFPSSANPEYFERGRNVKMYSFIQNHIVAEGISYFLDNEEDSYNIMVIGPTGAGKSHLINVLFNQPVCDSSAGHSSVTKEFVFIKGSHNNGSQKVTVADTVGLCDTEWDETQIFELIKGKINSNIKHIDAIVVVFRADRLLKTQVENIRKILTYFNYYKSHVSSRHRFLFVGTKAEFLTDEDKTELRKEAKEIFGLSCNPNTNEGEGNSSLIYVGFPPEKSLNELGQRGVQKSWQSLQSMFFNSKDNAITLERNERPKLHVENNYRSLCNIL